MHIFREVEITEKLPDGLQQEVDDLEAYFEADDWFNYGLNLELFEASVKSYNLAGKISWDTTINLLAKYQ